LTPDNAKYYSPFTKMKTSFNRTLDKRDVFPLVDTELEYMRKGSWMRLFPNKDSDKYTKFFQTESRNQIIIDYLKLERTIPDVFEFPGFYSKQH